MTDILFIGEKPIGEWAFAELLGLDDDRLRIVGAVSNGAAGAGWWNSCLVSELAKAKGIPSSDSDTMDRAKLTRLVAERCPDALNVVQGRTIISDEALRLVGGRAFNLHLAPLPSFRGFYSANHALLKGASEFAATIHWIAPTVDTGDIAFEEKISVAPDETAQSLYAKSIDAGMHAFRSLLVSLAGGEAVPRRVQLGESRYFSRKSLDAHRMIRDMSDGEEVDRKARAFYFPGFPPAYAELGGRRFAISPADPPEPVIALERIAASARRMLEVERNAH